MVVERHACRMHSEPVDNADRSFRRFYGDLHHRRVDVGRIALTLLFGIGVIGDERSVHSGPFDGRAADEQLSRFFLQVSIANGTHDAVDDDVIVFWKEFRGVNGIFNVMKESGRAAMRMRSVE